MPQPLEPFPLLLMLCRLALQFAALRIQASQFRLHTQQLVFTQCLDALLQGLETLGRFLQREIPLLYGACITFVLVAQLLLALLQTLAFGLGGFKGQHQFLAPHKL